MKMMKLPQKLLISLMIVFVLYNIVWVVNYRAYSEYVEDYEKIPKVFIKKNGDFTLTVKKPNYFSFTGNYAISKKIFLISYGLTCCWIASVNMD